MSYSTRVRVEDKLMTVVYAATQLPLATSIDKWSRSREVRRHMARTQTKYVLVMPNQSAGIEVWWTAQDKGVSIAASLDDWFLQRFSEDENAADDVVVVIPFDTRIYLAEASRGLVSNEWIVDEEKALEHLQRYADENRVIQGFAAGHGSALIEQYVELEPLPFALGEYGFRHALPVFVGNAVFHPSYILVVVAVFATIGLSQYGLDKVQQLLPSDDSMNQSQSIIESVMIPEVAYGGGTMLRELVRFLSLLEALYGDGLQSLEFTAPASVILSGTTVGYPVRAKQFADSHGASFKYNAAAWVIGMQLDMPRLDRGRPMDTQIMLRQLSAGWPDLELVEGPVEGLVNSTRFSIRKNVTGWDLLEIAQRLDGFPATISHLACEYGNYRLSACAISIETRTL